MSKPNNPHKGPGLGHIIAIACVAVLAYPNSSLTTEFFELLLGAETLFFSYLEFSAANSLGLAGLYFEKYHRYLKIAFFLGIGYTLFEVAANYLGAKYPRSKAKAGFAIFRAIAIVLIALTAISAAITRSQAARQESADLALKQTFASDSAYAAMNERLKSAIAMDKNNYSGDDELGYQKERAAQAEIKEYIALKQAEAKGDTTANLIVSFLAALSLNIIFGLAVRFSVWNPDYSKTSISMPVDAYSDHQEYDTPPSGVAPAMESRGHLFSNFGYRLKNRIGKITGYFQSGTTSEEPLEVGFRPPKSNGGTNRDKPAGQTGTNQRDTSGTNRAKCGSATALTRDKARGIVTIETGTKILQFYRDNPSEYQERRWADCAHHAGVDRHVPRQFITRKTGNYDAAYAKVFGDYTPVVSGSDWFLDTQRIGLLNAFLEREPDATLSEMAEAIGVSSRETVRKYLNNQGHRSEFSRN